MSLFVEENTERVKREKDAPIMVVIGNPPYNVGQKNENDNNKNRKYPVIDERIRETYAKDSRASNKNALSDAYVKFFRWATDRLGNRDGIVCLVSNNGFLEGIAFDGFRKQLAEEFTQIYHFDLGGNARKYGGGNVFGIKVGVGVTILIRLRKDVAAQHKPATIFYYKVDNDQNSVEKLAFLRSMGSIANVEWQELQPDERYIWVTEGMHSEFTKFLPMGIKELKASQNIDVPLIFRTYGGGVKTNRDHWVYDFSYPLLKEKINKFIETYNNDLDRWRRRGSSNTILDDFVTYDDTKIKWSVI